MPVYSTKTSKNLIYDMYIIENFAELEAAIFLHACYYSVEAAKTCLDAYHTTRTHVPEFFGNRDVLGQDIQSQMKILLVHQLDD